MLNAHIHTLSECLCLFWQQVSPRVFTGGGRAEYARSQAKRCADFGPEHGRRLKKVGCLHKKKNQLNSTTQQPALPGTPPKVMPAPTKLQQCVHAYKTHTQATLVTPRRSRLSNAPRSSKSSSTYCHHPTTAQTQGTHGTHRTHRTHASTTPPHAPLPPAVCTTNRR
jgi:hypothetical protein